MSGSAFHAAILDDDPLARVALVRLLKTTGIVAQDYGTSDELFEAIARKRPDCLLLDLEMPEMSGLDVLKYLDERHIRISHHHHFRAQRGRPPFRVPQGGRTVLVEQAARPGAFDPDDREYLGAIPRRKSDTDGRPNIFPGSWGSRDWFHWAGSVACCARCGGNSRWGHAGTRG